jgi:hypothetical protein
MFDSKAGAKICYEATIFLGFSFFCKTSEKVKNI